jgi:hypothetical protein
MSAICSAMSSRLIISNIASIFVVFHHLFSWIALETVDLHVSFILVTKAIAIKEGKQLQPHDYIASVMNPHM